MSLKKIKQEADCPDYNSADEGQGAAELRDRVRKMTRRIAGGAGFSRGQRDGEMARVPTRRRHDKFFPALLPSRVFQFRLHRSLSVSRPTSQSVIPHSSCRNVEDESSAGVRPFIVSHLVLQCDRSRRGEYGKNTYERSGASLEISSDSPDPYLGEIRN
ncbi:unnamed protein product [Pleuronectes platessa]|uniref:Uncharacterized protein n=1 Tax=Pleuronectes platessa TaxID=8262 RepID=A0A9N7VM42_PLEPL|nr:unnamed protein product [Pleuronectes platessa]